MVEEWKWIKGYEGIYQISNMGRIKSFYKNETYGELRSVKHSGGWYLTLPLVKNGRIKTARVHQLVAEHFIGEIPKGYHVHHKDGNKQNNRVDNLEIIHPSKHREETLKQKPDLYKSMNEYNQYVKPRHIRQYDLEGHFIAEYANCKIASELTGVCMRNIHQVAYKEAYNNKGNIRRQAGGFKWVFADEDEGVIR